MKVADRRARLTVMACLPLSESSAEDGNFIALVGTNGAADPVKARILCAKTGLESAKRFHRPR